ncbi:LysM peptidoglycan-binding domain-containing protein [Photobacterium sp. 1_MG-2023]|uniref:toxin VasX n=1 Tax=Photobacterium sp. 1_MG-2023 TaxID=3062646 RepID=UPI0026E27CA3|nr:LysM peptidoglycan-binding domain-containing protein [Photobacterium sp. 1_MG-2023]MDO6708655.1 LysM peptidoglycan-binding domain-containing protein [Photobacterium sp. 1_MG-2023]
MSSKKYHSDQDTDQTSPKRSVKAYYAPLTDLNPYVAECRPTDAEPAEPMPEHKIVVELAGQWPSNSATLRLGKTAEQSVKIAKPAQDPEAGHRSLAVFEGLMEEPRNLYLSLSRENVSEPLDLLLAKALEPVEKGTKKEEWDNVLVPIRALVYLGDTQDKAHVADLKGGYLYIFWKGKVWRELEITSEGYYRDIDIAYYRSRAGYSDAHEVRKADGFSLPQFWVPYKIQGDYQQSTEGVKILFSPTQMTIPQLDELEQKTDSLAQISSTLDELSVYSKTQGLEIHDQVAAIDSAEVASEHLSSKKSWLDGQARVLKKLHDSKTAVVYLKEPLADSPKFEYAVELACTEETFNALKLDEAIVVAPTAAETETEVLQPTISQDALIFVSRLRVNEAKTVQVKSGQVALSTSIDGVMPDPIETHTAKDGFIPVQLAVEVGHRLALPTIGYYYHFMADALLHEYKITGDEENWHYQATKSNAESLTDDVLDDRELNAVILPWKIQNEPAKRQHLLYSPHKLTLNDLKQMDGEWLDEHATLLDLDAMMAAGKQAQTEAVQYQREGQLYTIQKGDTLTAIAKAHGITLDVVLTLNPDYQVGDRQDHIYPGETLILPVDESHEAQEITSTHVDYMTVKQDASVDEVAALAGLDTATLLAYNPYLQSLDPTDVVMAEDVVIVNKTESQSPDTRTHEVKAIHDALGHESLSSIAALYDQPPQKLAEINGLDLSDPQFTLQVGQVLKIDPPHPQAEGVQRNTYPAVLVEDYNLAENMVYHYAQPKISAQFAPIHHASVLAPKATVVRVASLTTAADIQTIKLCLGRYALDEVDAPYNQALVLEQKQGKHPIDVALSEKYAVKPHPLAKETAHSLTIRQIRDGYVYVYYAAVNSHVAARYPHAGELHEFRYADGLFEYNDETTPYLPCHSLNGWAYIVFSEREWTEKQRNQFQQDPEFRRALAKNTGAVYDFNQRLVSAKGEEEVFTDLPVLVSDIDAGPANQDHRFSDTTTPTHQSDTEN